MPWQVMVHDFSMSRHNTIQNTWIHNQFKKLSHVCILYMIIHECICVYICMYTWICVYIYLHVYVHYLAFAMIIHECIMCEYECICVTIPVYFSVEQKLSKLLTSINITKSQTVITQNMASLNTNKHSNQNDTLELS